MWDYGTLAIDVSSLPFAVLLVMLVSCMALFAHWFSNKAITGLNLVAAGVLVFSLGIGLQFNYLPVGGIEVTLLGEALIIFGHMWVWHGVAEFLQNRQHPLVRFSFVIGSMAVGILIYQAYANIDFALRVVTHAVFVSILSGGIIYTLVRAGGGGGRFYKGIIRRTMVGAGMMAGLFVVHIVYGLYRAYETYMRADDLFGTILPLQAISQIEAGKVEILAGTNLPMLIRLIEARETSDLDGLARLGEEAGKRYISIASDVLEASNK